MKHPNIVSFYGWKKENKFIKIYMEYMDQGSVQDMLNKFKVFPEEVVIIYTKQILNGLEFLHSHGIIHRDIKGGNILVNNEGIVKLGDFGSAKNLKNSYLDSFIGTTC